MVFSGVVKSMWRPWEFCVGVVRDVWGIEGDGRWSVCEVIESCVKAVWAVLSGLCGKVYVEDKVL